MGTRAFRIPGGNFSGAKSQKITILRTVSWRREFSFHATKRPKIFNSWKGTLPFLFREEFSGAETSETMVISRTVSRLFRRRREYAFSVSETSKNCHLPNGKPAVSYFGRKYFHVPKRRNNEPLCQRREYAFSGSKTYKNGHFANQKPAISSFGSKCFSDAEATEKIFIF